MHLRLLPLVAFLLLSAPACTATLPSPAVLSAAESYVRDELFFGLRKPDGALVTEAEWQAFVDSVVTLRFSAGLTVLTAYGQYRHANGSLIHEPSKVLILIHQGTPEADRHIREIAAEYCRRFQQESVMRVRESVSADFLDAQSDSIRFVSQFR